MARQMTIVVIGALRVKTIYNGLNLQCMIKEVKLLDTVKILGVICPCPWAIYMYKFVKFLNVFYSETSWTICIKFHMGPSGERKLTI